MELSVVIPTHDRAATLRRTLDALTEQTLPRTEFEILVVDDGSSEPNRIAARRDCSDRGFTLLEKEQGGLASARNLGADRARGRILHFLDDDVRPEPRALAQHLASHEAHEEPVAVVGALPFPPWLRPTPFLWYLEKSAHYDLYRNPRKYPGGTPPMPPMNGNSSIRRDVFDGAGRYDESFRYYGSEDLELGYRLAKRGVRFVYNPRAVGYHEHVKDFARFCGDMETAGESLIRVFRKYPEIRAAKKIDVLLDPMSALPLKKKVMKLVLSLTERAPRLLELPRWIVRRAENAYVLRAPLFPLYRWIAYYHYAVGMRRGLTILE